MDYFEVDILIAKFLDNEATEEEQSFLLQWIQVPENKAYLEEYVRTEIWIKYSLNATQVEKQLSTLSIYPERSKGRRFSPMVLAAVFMLFLGLGSFLYLFLSPESVQKWNTNTLILEIRDSGTSRYFSLENHVGLPKALEFMTLVKDSLLRYDTPESQSKKTLDNVYHTVHVPYGKTFKVQLSDGSLVQLNAGSKLTYPYRFDGFDLREVSLSGEAYFDVASNGIPFHVLTDGLSTKVLGTSFNVSAYRDESLREVVLVEGKVEVSTNTNTPLHKNSKTMVPNQRAILTAGDKNLSIATIDTKNYVAWTKGELVFSNAGINEIIKKLERKFKVDILNRYDKLSVQRFNGRFKDETFTEILETIKAHTNFSYSREGNTIIILEP